MTPETILEDLEQINARLVRIETAVSTMAWWLTQAQTGFGQKDARGIQDILDGAPGVHESARQDSA